MRRAITGGPRTGKTTSAGSFALHTDDLTGWSQASATASEWFNCPDPDLCVEGVTVARALRKWLRANPTGRPIDELEVRTQAHGSLTPGQAAMTKGHDAILREIQPELERRGVRIVRR